MFNSKLLVYQSVQLKETLLLFFVGCIWHHVQWFHWFNDLQWISYMDIHVQ